MCAWHFRERVIFLCYHGVTEKPGRPDGKGLHVNSRRFATHLDFLQKRYHITSLKEFITARREGRSLPAYSVVLTFDDGFRNFKTVAAPMLAERKMRATVFLITDRAGEKSNDHLADTWSSEDDRRYLTWEEAKQLQAQGFDFGSHTCSHPHLLTLTERESRHELQHSHDDLIRNLAVDIPTLSYPKGEYSDLLADDARRVGYACAVTTDRGVNEANHDLFTLGRTLIGDFDDEASFAVRVSGLRWILIKMLAVFRPSHRSAPTIKPPAPISEPYPGEIYEITH